MPLDLLAQPRVIRREDLADVLRVEPLGRRGRADEVGEEDRDDLPLLACGIPGYDRPGRELYADELRLPDGLVLRGNCAYASDCDYVSA